MKAHTFRWPWESMLRIFNSFFEDLWVVGTSLPTRVDICELHIMVACAHNVGCNQALATPTRLGSLTWRPSTNMRSINSSYASLHWREPLICKQHLYMWMKEYKIVICVNILIERTWLWIALPQTNGNICYSTAYALEGLPHSDRAWLNVGHRCGQPATSYGTCGW